MIRCLVVLAVLLSTMVCPHSSRATQEDGRPSDQVLVVDRSSVNKAVDDYVGMTRSAIQKAWTAPLDLEIPNAVKGKVRVNLLVTRSGGLESFKLIEGSGHPVMDRSLVDAIRKAAPFPPFPPEIASKKMLIRANLVVATLPSVQPVRVSGTAAQLPAPFEPGNAPETPAWGKAAASASEKPQPEESDKPKTETPPKRYSSGDQNRGSRSLLGACTTHLDQWMCRLPCLLLLDILEMGTPEANARLFKLPAKLPDQLLYDCLMLSPVEEK
jgi:TonB family protein